MVSLKGKSMRELERMRRAALDFRKYNPNEWTIKRAADLAAVETEIERRESEEK